MKKKFFTIILSIFVIVICYTIIGFWGLFDIKNYNDFLFSDKKNLDFHKYYSDKMHHLRNVNMWNEKEYLFSTIYQDNSFEKTMLFQGDSWIEDISKNELAKEFLIKYGKNKKLNIFNAGITSFAPSVIHAQYKVLKNDFLIKPDILIIYIDQTDIGDEFCRYKNNKVYSNEKFSHVKREKFTRATYDYSKSYLYSELSLENNFKKIIKFPYLKLNYFFNRNVNLIKQISANGLENRNRSKCGFQEIMKELISYNEEAEKVFKKSLIELLDFLSNEIYLEKVILISFPHINHYKNLYTVNVSNYIEDTIQKINHEKIEHLNLNNLDFSNINIDEIFRINDPGSHLNDKYHLELFIKKIISKI